MFASLSPLEPLMPAPYKYRIQEYRDTGIHGYMDIWIYGYIDTWIHGYMDTWIHGRYCNLEMYGYICLSLLFKTCRSSRLAIWRSEKIYTDTFTLKLWGSNYSAL